MYSFNRPFEDSNNVEVALSENEFDTPDEESAKHKKCRDKCVAKCSGSPGSIVKAFNRQDAHIGVCDKIVIVVLTMCDLTLSSISLYDSCQIGLKRLKVAYPK